MNTTTKKINENTKRILSAYENKLNKQEQFYHVLDQIGKHIIKLTRLKENEDRPGHFNEEVADIHLLTTALIKLEQINQDTIESASDHFAEKVEGIYGKNAEK